MPRRLMSGLGAGLEVDCNCLAAHLQLSSFPSIASIFAWKGYMVHKMISGYRWVLLVDFQPEDDMYFPLAHILVAEPGMDHDNHIQGCLLQQHPCTFALPGRFAASVVFI